jgi:hypothetical protein
MEAFFRAPFWGTLPALERGPAREQGRSAHAHGQFDCPVWRTLRTERSKLHEHT